MRMLRLSAILGSILLFAGAPAHALSTTYSLAMSGALEALPNVGDPDGLATGTITLDDTTGAISWNITYSNLDPLTGFHIHGPAGSPGLNAPILVSPGPATSGGPGTLISSTVTTVANVTSIVANPTDFYVNIHTTAFPNGAVRGQLGVVVPEPSPALLVAFGLLALGWRRRAVR